MSFFDRLKARIARAFASSPVENAVDRRPDLLRALGADQDIIAEYVRLQADPKAALDERDDLDIDPENIEGFSDAVLLSVAKSNHLIVPIDWVGEPDELLEGLSLCFETLDQPPLLDAERAAILDYAMSKPSRRGDFIGWMFGPLAEAAEKRGLKIIDLNEGSDCYHFAALPKVASSAWTGTSLGHVTVEDVSWQFEQQLVSSPYERFYTKR